MRVGLIADTHGFLDPRAVTALDGVEAILHAGDIGSADVLAGLREIAPVTAVAGNNDTHLAQLGLPVHVDSVMSGVAIHLVHRLIDARPEESAQVVVFGHSHRALVERRDGRLYVNPGAAGRVGFHRELSVGLLHIRRGKPRAQIVLLGPRPPRIVRKTLA
jgi:uncharacterized protein